MELKFHNREISFYKELNELDKLAILFSEQLSAFNIRHVFLSGYVAILFGRNRSSEDIDVVSEQISFDTFAKFWENINKTLECINISDVKCAYNEYLKNNTAIRFAKKGEIIPNIELKFESNEMHREAISFSLNVLINDRKIPIAPIEQQIAYKIYMGSEKDIEDARFLFKLFEENLKENTLVNYLELLEIPLKKVKQYLGWSN